MEVKIYKENIYDKKYKLIFDKYCNDYICNYCDENQNEMVVNEIIHVIKIYLKRGYKLNNKIYINFDERNESIIKIYEPSHHFVREIYWKGLIKQIRR